MPGSERRYLGVIPARGGSKRLPRKNVAPLAGKPLIAYTIEAALASSRLARTIVSTDDEQIARIARQFGAAVPFVRPSDLAGDETAMTPVVQHALAHAATPEIDAVVLLQPTSPFRTHHHIDAAIASFESMNADTVTAVCPMRHHPYYAWTLAGDELAPFFSIAQQMLPRQQLPPALIENGSIYVVRRELIERGTIYGQRVVPYVMDERASLDVDTIDDFRVAELRLAGQASE